MLAEGSAREVGEGITGKAEDKGQQQVRPLDARGFHAQKGGKGVSDGNTAEQPSHDLGKLHFPRLEDGISEETQHRQHEQHRHKMRAEIITRHSEKSAGKTQIRQSIVLHTADALLKFFPTDTCQQTQCKQHHKGRCPQHHPHQHRHADDGYQHSGL